MSRLILALMTAAMLAAPLAGCGKKALPQPPDPDKSVYPRTYPAPR